MKWVLMAALLAGLGELAVYLVLASREPVYQGKTVDRWLDNLAEMRREHASTTPVGPLPDLKMREGARTALAVIGPKAVPFVVNRLKLAESPWHHKYHDAYPRWPAWLKKITPSPKLELADAEGGEAFMDIGPAVEPQLVPLLDDDSVAVRTAAASALGSLNHYHHTDIRNAIPGLTRGVEDQDSEVRFMSGLALSYIGPDAASAVDALTRGLNGSGLGRMAGSRANTRSSLARALGKIGPKSREALPKLRDFMTDPDVYLRVVSAVAVWRIDGDVTNTLPVLVAGLDKVNPNSMWEVLEGIGEMGPRAKSAIPALTNLLDKGSSGNGEKIADALEKINAEAAVK